MNIDIKIPYTTRPSMVKNLDPVCSRINNYYYQEKLIQLDRFARDLWAVSDLAYQYNLIYKVSKHLGLPNKDSIVDLALCFNEDIAIMYNGVLAAICFCFPSSWIPADRIGMNLSDIHKPVADNSNLVKYSDRLAKTMADPTLGSFKRQVWTLTTSSCLSAHPKVNKPELSNFDQLYFRLETQTTEPLGDGFTSIFFVKVEVFPINSVWEQYGSRIRDSIMSMSDNILDYKNLRQIKSLLV